MSNLSKAIPEVEIELAGKKWMLVYSTLAFCLLEKETGLNSLDGAMWTNVNLSTMTAMLWAGLVTNYPDMTLDKVRKSLGMADMPTIFLAIQEGMKKASPEEKKSESSIAEPPK